MYFCVLFFSEEGARWKLTFFVGSKWQQNSFYNTLIDQINDLWPRKRGKYQEEGKESH
jgi:hypothetical protein